MAKKSARKVQERNGCLYVNIPRSFGEELGIKAGDNVLVILNELEKRLLQVRKIV